MCIRDSLLINAEISVTSVNEIIDCENKMLNAWIVSFLRTQNITLSNYKLLRLLTDVNFTKETVVLRRWESETLKFQWFYQTS